MIVKHKKAPGQKFIKNLDQNQLVWLNSIGGVLLFSLGQSLFAISWIRIYQGFDKSTWTFMIILGLLTTLIGILLLGLAMIGASQIKMKKFYKKRYKNLVKERSEKLSADKLKIDRK